MKRKLLVGLTALLLAACSSDNNAADTTAPATTTTTTTPTTTVPPPTTTLPPTTTVSPATTAAPTTTATPTTAAPTIAPPTTSATTAAAGSPADVAVAEVTARLDAFWTAMDQCFEAPNDCDSEAIIAEYADPTTPIATWFQAWINDFRKRNLRATQSDQITRQLVQAEATPEGDAVITTQCITNRALLLEDNASGSTVVDDEVGRTRAVMTWRKSDGRWTVQDSEYIPLEQAGDQICRFA